MKKIILGFLSFFNALFGYSKEPFNNQEQPNYEIRIKTDITEGSIILKEINTVFKKDMSFTFKENILHENKFKDGMIILKGKIATKRLIFLVISTSNGSTMFPMYLESGKISIDIKLQKDKSFVCKGTPTQENMSIGMQELISIENKLLNDENFAKDEINANQIKSIIDDIGVRDEKGEFYYYVMQVLVRMLDVEKNKQWFDEALAGEFKTDMKRIFAYTLKMAAVSNETPDSIDSNTEIIKNASFIDVEGKTKNILQFGENKIILIDFWASWCAPCISNITKLKELQAKHGDKLVIVGVSTDKDEDKWKNAIKKHNADWVQLRDDKNIVDLLKIKSIPYFMVCNKDGKIVYAGNSSLSNVDNVISSW